MRFMSLCAGVCTAVAAATAPAAQPPPAAASAPPQPPSAAAPAQSARVLVQVRFGVEGPGMPAPARLQIPAMRLDIDTDEHGERALPGVPKGKVRLRIFVAGADPCTVDFVAAGDKATTVKVFVPKRGRGDKCNRLTD